jgi:hypothetical protein
VVLIGGNSLHQLAQLQYRWRAQQHTSDAWLCSNEEMKASNI